MSAQDKQQKKANQRADENEEPKNQLFPGPDSEDFGISLLCWVHALRRHRPHSRVVKAHGDTLISVSLREGEEGLIWLPDQPTLSEH